MMIGTYVGSPSWACQPACFWILAPFKNPEVIWVGFQAGLRTTLPVSDSLAQVLDKIVGVLNIWHEVPTGLFG